MTNELEEQFFQCFGIKPKTNQVYGMQLDYHIDDYPQITDHVLLKLICIIGSIYICAQDRETLKEHILVQCMNTQMYSRDIKHQVRTLFEEEKWIL